MIPDAPIELVHAYDPLLFVGSVVIAAFGGYVALWLIDRVRAVSDSERGLRWLAAASAAMGVGIWSMHFTGMLALRLPVPVGYDPGLTLLSVVVAVLASLLAFSVIRREQVTAPQWAAASGLMGAAIAGMHYTGMAAMRLPGEMYYRPELVVASVAVGVLASGAALWLFLRHRDRVEVSSPLMDKAVGGLLLGLAVSGLHYTAMAAARFRDLRQGARLPGEGLLLTGGLDGWVAIGSLVLLGLGLVAALVDRRLHLAYAEELRESRQRYETLLTEISDTVTIVDRDGTIRYQSPSVEHLFGYDRGERVGRSAFETIHPDDRENVRRLFRQARDRGEPVAAQFRLKHRDGSWRRVESTSVIPEDRELGALVAVTRDITERVEAQQKYRSIFEMTPTAIAISSLETGRFVDVNPAFEDLLGNSREDAIGAASDDVGVWARPDDRERVLEEIRESGSVKNREVLFRHADGETIDVLFSGTVLDIGGESHFLGIAKDISERKAFEEALEHRALHDRLTGLPNRQLVRDRAQQALRRADRRGAAFAVAYLDLDGFKPVNDQYGHPVGDRVLVDVAERLRWRTRDEDTMARVGGDEFLAVLEGVSGEADARRAAGRLLGAFEPPFPVPGGEVRLRASCGVVLVGPEVASGLVDADVGASVGELIREADRAMYAAKDAGGGRVRLVNASRLPRASPDREPA